MTENTVVQRRPVAAVIGNGRSDEVVCAAAEELGCALVDEGFRVLTGGLGGVMEAASRGAHASPAYLHGTTIGVLPTYDRERANPYVDIAIATGLNYARNVVVVASADVVVVVGGRSGTLSEVALAWGLDRPVVAVDVPGWGSRLAGEAIDDRREDRIHGPYPPAEAARVCRSLLGTRPAPREFT